MPPLVDGCSIGHKLLPPAGYPDRTWDKQHPNKHLTMLFLLCWFLLITLVFVKRERNVIILTLIVEILHRNLVETSSGCYFTPLLHKLGDFWTVFNAVMTSHFWTLWSCLSRGSGKWKTNRWEEEHSWPITADGVSVVTLLGSLWDMKDYNIQILGSKLDTFERRHWFSGAVWNYAQASWIIDDSHLHTGIISRWN